MQRALSRLYEHEGRTRAHFRGLSLATVFQPLVSLAHGRAIGHEALLRTHSTASGPASGPQAAFDLAVSVESEVHLDRLARALHIANFRAAGVERDWVLLNISPRVVIEGHATGGFFEPLLEHFGVPPERIVVEVLESAAYDETSLANAVRFFKRLGCLVAIDDYGAGHANFERIWRVAPDIVKLDRLVTTASAQRRVRRILPRLVSLFHEAGCLVTMEGIETADHVLAAMEADVDFVQGFFFGKPAEAPVPGRDVRPLLNPLLARFRSNAERRGVGEVEEMSTYLEELQRAAERFEVHASLRAASRALLVLERTQRCYLLDAEGVQLESNLESQHGGSGAPARFDPLADAQGANWCRRDYFQQAIAQPRVCRVSRPYLSLRDGSTCITISIALPVGGSVQVLCADLSWDEPGPALFDWPARRT